VFCPLIGSLIGCSGGNSEPVDGTGGVNSAGNGSSNGIGLTPDNAPADIFGDWVTGCIAENDANGELTGHTLYAYSIVESTWTESVEQYAIDDPMCANLLGTAVYNYQIQILDTATAATLNGDSFGNAINVDILDTVEDTFLDAVAEDLGSGLSIWLLKDGKLYTRSNFDGIRPSELVEKYTFTRQ